MRQMFQILLAVCFCCTSVLAQSFSPPEIVCRLCPPISIDALPEFVEPGQVITMFAKITGADTIPLKFNWKVSGGEIIEGQETLFVKIRAGCRYNTKLTVEIEVNGLDASCDSIASVNSITSLPPNIDLPYYRKVAFGKEKLYLDQLAAYLKSDEEMQVMFLIHFPKKATRKYIDFKLKRIVNHLVRNRSISATRISFIKTDNFDFELTQMWAFSPKIPCSPEFDRNALIKGENLIKNLASKPKTKRRTRR